MLFATLACLLLLKPSAASSPLPTCPAATFEGCTADQQLKISEGIDDMLKMVDKTILASQIVERDVGDNETLGFVKSHYTQVRERFFGKTSSRENARIQGVLQSLRENWKHIIWICVDETTDSYCEAGGAASTEHKESRVYLCDYAIDPAAERSTEVIWQNEECFAMYEKSPLEHVIAHEAFHCHAIAPIHMIDVCVTWGCIFNAPPDYIDLMFEPAKAYGLDTTQRLALWSPSAAMRNADNYALFLRQVYGL